MLQLIGMATGFVFVNIFWQLAAAVPDWQRALNITMIELIVLTSVAILRYTQSPKKSHVKVRR